MSRFISKNWRIIVIFLASLAICWPLFVKGYFSHHDDIQIIRIFEMRKCFSDMQIPCRWVPDLGNGYGFPMFNFYGVIPYYLAGITSYIVGYIISAKILFFLPLIFGGFFVYLLAKDLFGEDAGLLAGVLYTLAPYRALDSYVRGAITELFAISLIPLVLFFYMRLVKKVTLTNFLGATLSLGIFFLNHNITTMFLAPILFAWLVIRVVIDGIKNIKQVLLSLGLAFGLASFFLLPAYFETGLIQTQNLLQSQFIPNFRAHFVTLRQLFLSRFWGYGASTWGEDDGLSFQVGWPQWWLAAVALIIFFIKQAVEILRGKFKIKKELSELLTVGFIFLLLIFSLFMTHNKSTFIWEHIKLLQFAQFPWRFLGIAILAVSLLGGFVVTFLGKRIRIPLIIFAVILTIVLDFKYFKPETFFKDRIDKDYFSGPLWEYQYQGAIYDYLPKTAVLPYTSAPNRPVVLSGKAEIVNYDKQSKSWHFSINSAESSEISIPVFDFPNWTVYMDGMEVAHTIDNGTGSILVSVEEGKHDVSGYFKNTWIRSISNLLSAISVFSLILILKKRRKFRIG